MRTKFYRFLLYCGKGTMHVTSSVFKLVPMQDFSDRSDIDWSEDAEAVDRQLFRKYKLDAQEQTLIAKMFRK